jgi:hypothetical protein
LEERTLTAPLMDRILLTILLFALLYYILAVYMGNPLTFEDPIVDSLYFSVTVTTTVGFGDITPKTRLTKLIVGVQMLATVFNFAELVAKLMQKARPAPAEGEKKRKKH